MAAAIALALLFAGAFFLSSSDLTQAQSDKPRVTIQALLVGDETAIPQGALAMFTVTRTGSTSSELTVKLQTFEPRRQIGFGDNPTTRQETVTIGRGDSRATLYVPTVGQVGDQGWIEAQIKPNSDYDQGSQYQVSTDIRDATDDDAIVSIEASESSIAEGRRRRIHAHPHREHL